MSYKIPTSIKFHFFSFLNDFLRLIAVLLIVCTAAISLIYHVSNQVKITRLGYKIADVTTEHRRLLEENRKLTIEAAVQGHSERIANVAKEEFGLHPVRADQVRKLPKKLLNPSVEKPHEGAQP